jgi:hypothetical protein
MGTPGQGEGDPGQVFQDAGAQEGDRGRGHTTADAQAGTLQRLRPLEMRGPVEETVTGGCAR